MALRLPAFAAFVAVATLFSSCSRPDTGNEKKLPDNFVMLDDASMVACMMEVATPDSVARFICDAALGKVAAGRIDTLSVAAAYAYSAYTDSALMVFSREFDDYSGNLPLEDKMKIYSMAGEGDPQKLGYQLGLEYVAHIREKSLGLDQVKVETEAFRKACGDDSVTYKRFMKGFRTVLKADRGKDLPEAIYNEFTDD